MRFLMRSLIVCIATAGLGSGAAIGQESGLASMHAKVRVGSRLCMSGHTHTGFSSGEMTRLAAIETAIENWEGFTAWEYGDTWSKFKKAANRKKFCVSGPGGYECTVVAAPCKSLKRRRYVRKRARKQG